MKSIVLILFLFQIETFSVEFEKINYANYENSIKLSNAKIEMIIITDIGPRIIHFSFKGKENIFYEDDRFLGKKDQVEWRNYGGHRLWIAPEKKELTYIPDNTRVRYYWDGRVLSLVSIVPNMNLQKEILIELDELEPEVKLTHRIKNLSPKQIKIAAWSISVMNKNGKAKLQLSEIGVHPQNLLPVDSLIFWKYTILNDSRLKFGEREVVISQDSNFEQPIKLGIKGQSGTNKIFYENDFCQFIKKYTYFPNMEYADLKASAQVFSNQRFIELESLSPLKTLKKNEIIEHIEEWEINPKD